MKKQKNTFGSGGPRNILIVVVVMLLSLVVLTKLVDDTRTKDELKYSQFMNMVEGKKVKSVSVDGSLVTGITKDNKRFEVVAPTDHSMLELLRKNGVEVALANAAVQTNIWHLLMLFVLITVVFGVWYLFRQSRGQGGGGGGGNIFTMGKSRAKMFMPSTIKEKFTDVAGANEAKEELEDVIDFLKNPEKYKKIGAKITRGALLVGSPGNGKTLLARAVAGEANCPFFSISGSDFIEVFVGVGASRVRDLFAQARKHAPSIIFIDEIDAVGRHRGSGLGGGNDEREQTLNQLLTEMDGFETAKESVIVLAATNRPDVLDSALLRPGRFDRRVEVPYPDLISREQILKVHARNVTIDPDLDLKKVARGTPGFSGADLANLINEAAIIASKGDEQRVTMKDVEEARDKVLLGKEIKTMVLSEDERRMTSFHESGHALVRLLLPEVSDPLHKVTIVPRGRALGVTHSLPEREKYSTTKEEMLATIKSALGGRIAEDIVFNKVSTGAYSDFKAATSIARDMVCRYGMSDTLGPIVYSQQQGDFVYSQETAHKIDEEVRRIIEECEKDATKLLNDNRDKLDKLAETLLEKETMYASEIYTLLDIESREDHKLI